FIVLAEVGNAVGKNAFPQTGQGNQEVVFQRLEALFHSSSMSQAKPNTRFLLKLGVASGFRGAEGGPFKTPGADNAEAVFAVQNVAGNGFIGGGEADNAVGGPIQ